MNTESDMRDGTGRYVRRVPIRPGEWHLCDRAVYRVQDESTHVHEQ